MKWQGLQNALCSYRITLFAALEFHLDNQHKKIAFLEQNPPAMDLPENEVKTIVNDLQVKSTLVKIYLLS